MRLILWGAISLILASCGSKNPVTTGGGDDPNDGDSATLPVVVPTCGEVLTSSVILSGSISCPDATGSVLTIEGDDVMVFGSEFSINAPMASVGVEVRGDRAVLFGVKANGLTTGTGIFLVNADAPQILSCELKDNLYGIRFATTDGAVSREAPVIMQNNFSGSTEYAIHANLPEFKLLGEWGNTFGGSRNGIYFEGGDGLISGLDLSNDPIQHTAIFGAEARSLTIENSNLSTSLSSDIFQRRTGLHLYRVENIEVSRVTAKGFDAGVKLSTEMGTEPRATIQNSDFSGEAFAGVVIQSYDGTEYGLVTITDNDLRDNAQPIWQPGSPVLAPGSVLSPNQTD